MTFNFTSGVRVLMLLILSAGMLQSCKKEEPTDLSALSIIPKPVSIVPTRTSFTLSSSTTIVAPPELKGTADYLSERLNKELGINVTVATESSQRGDNISLVLISGDGELGDEGYELVIEEESVTINANKPAGIFYGVQTLLQIAPVPDKAQQSEAATLATGTIRDYPNYSWRGTMLDVSRHFFGVDDVKRVIDLISYYKMNVLHLGLSNDQGWRIEIKSWPNLALHGGSTQVGGGKGGYYTQEQYKDIVAYAASRYITIVPEIDLPGHINAALASYGELNGGIVVPKEGRLVVPSTSGILDGKNKPTDLYTGIEVGWSTLRLDKPATFKFVNDVLRELAAITPGPYVHIGGDEAHVTKKDDYIQFINKFREIVQANGKKMVGWEEVAQGNIDEGVVAQYWHSEKYMEMAVEKGANIILSPSKHAYLDMQYDSTTRIGLHWAAYVEVDEAYNWDPQAEVKDVDPKKILGVEAALWTETVENMTDIEFLTFPRLPGIAEIGWSPAEGRSWYEYKVRLGAHGPRMRAWEIDYYPSKRVDWK